jgi:hypothetical protein
MTDLFMRSIRALALGMVAWLAFVGPAHALAYVGRWDPAYGQPFNDLGWRGEIKVDSPTNCGAAADFTGIVTCAPGAAVVNYSFVELYMLSDPSTTVDLLTFAPPAPATFTVNMLEFADGAITGLVTGRSDFIYDPVEDVDFALQFAVDGIMATPLPGRIGVPTDYTGPILIFRDMICIEEHHKKGDYDHDEDCDDYKFAYGTNNLTDVANRPVVTFSVVSEPGTLALVLFGVLAGAGLRRRSA